MDFEIEIFNKRDIESVYKLFTNVYKSDDIIFIEKIKWLFTSKNSFALVVKNDNNQIIATRVAIKWPLKIKNKKIEAYQFCGTCVHQNYRRLGIFSFLNQKAISYLRKNKGQIIYNISVDKAKIGYQKLGWKYSKGFRRLTKVYPTNYFKNQPL